MMSVLTIEETAQRARALFETSGYSCAESLLLAIAESQGIQSDLFPQIASGLCGGMSRTGGPCGAVTGAILGLGLIAGVHQPGADHTPTYEITQRFLKAFKERFGSIQCPDLTSCDLGTPEGRARFKAEHVFARCTEYVTVAAELALTAVSDPEA
jgi:C_GCAxxG_C_C family probable redox protein